VETNDHAVKPCNHGPTNARTTSTVPASSHPIPRSLTPH
jgi:hypothetical protein